MHYTRLEPLRISACLFRSPFSLVPPSAASLLHHLPFSALGAIDVVNAEGVVASLSARCSVLAAANPIGGHYNRGKTIAENLKVQYSSYWGNLGGCISPLLPDAR